MNAFLGFSRSDVAIVTGAGSGIGRAVVEQLLAAGVSVAAWDIVADALESLAAAADGAGAGRLRTYEVDVTRTAEIAAGLAGVERDLGPAGLLVNNAGPASGTALDFTEGLAASAGSVHAVTAAWLATAGAQAGSVVNVASVSGVFNGAAPTAWYAAGKAAVAGFTRHLALQRPRGVRANAVAPGIIGTPRTASLLASPEGRAVIERTPMGRAGRPEDVAACVTYLLSPAADYVNGVVLAVDGGNLLTQ